MDVKLICLLCFCYVINYSNNSLTQNGQDLGGRIVRIQNKIPISSDRQFNEETESLEHQQIENDDEISYAKMITDQIMGSVQTGIIFAMSYTISGPKCDLLMSHFRKVDTIVFPRSGSSKTPKHHYPKFIFKTYAPNIFHRFRELYGIEHDAYKESFLLPLQGMSNPGASGSIFYTTQDDKFMIKTVQKNESRFLKKLLSGYYLNLKQNPQTILPKFYGHYRYHSKSVIYNDVLADSSTTENINIRFVTMNNLLPSNIVIHEKYDLKGSTYNRIASDDERSKNKPTYKDIDFKDDHPDGIYLNPVIYEKLVKILEKDCKVLQSFKIMDYSLLMGVHYVDRDKEEEKNQSEAQPPDVVENDDIPIEILPMGFTRVVEESPKPVYDTLREEKSQSEDQSRDAKNEYVSTTKGIRALSKSEERLLLFVGIIDVLQSFGFKKKLEHMFKAGRRKGDQVSVHNPNFYASRFLNFVTKKVFKIAMFPTNEWLSTFENNSSGVSMAYPSSLHIDIEETSKEDTTDAVNNDVQSKKIPVKKRLGPRRVGNDGKVTYKKVDTYQIQKSVQIGIEYTIKNVTFNSEQDVVMSDFFKKKAIVFPPGGLNGTSHHTFPEFTFKSYAPSIFNYFRASYHIESEDYIRSFCDSPLHELSNPGASGSIFYTTNDDKYIMKTVQPEESRFLKNIFPWYYIYFNENQSTLLPKFFGHYRYQCSPNYFWMKSITGKLKKNIRLIVMNNLIPSSIEIHEKYDLKGSTHNRKVSEEEKKKEKPTYKDLDFIKKHPFGIFLEPDSYIKLLDTLKRDVEVLEGFKIMDYSLLMGVHYVNPNQTTKKKPIVQGLSNTVDKENDGLKSEAQSPEDFEKYALSMGGIPATNENKQRLILFVGIIDVLQDYGFKKKMEHKLKSIIHDGNTISVINPETYKLRFLNFITESVFKKLLGPLNKVSSFVETRKCEINYKQRQEWLQQEVLPWDIS